MYKHVICKGYPIIFICKTIICKYFVWIVNNIPIFLIKWFFFQKIVFLHAICKFPFLRVQSFGYKWTPFPLPTFGALTVAQVSFAVRSVTLATSAPTRHFVLHSGLMLTVCTSWSLCLTGAWCAPCATQLCVTRRRTARTRWTRWMWISPCGRTNFFYSI